jgi:hypothetical protein
MAVKVFTLEEANRLIPQIELTVRFLVNTGQTIVQLKDQLSVLLVIGAHKSKSPEHGEYHKKKQRLDDLATAYNRKLEALQKTGCLIKDLQHGLVDFYGVKDDRLIFLCWKLGEKEIRYWHELHAGFRGRRPVTEL